MKVLAFAKASATLVVWPGRDRFEDPAPLCGALPHHAAGICSTRADRALFAGASELVVEAICVFDARCRRAFHEADGISFNRCSMLIEPFQVRAAIWLFKTALHLAGGRGAVC